VSLLLPGATPILTGIALAQDVDGDDPMPPEATEIWEPAPRIVSSLPEGAPPSDAVILFDGEDLAEWESVNDGPAAWDVENGTMTVRPGTGDIRSKSSFGDVQLHVEWRTPAHVEGEGQDRGNSGVYLMSRYEVQVLDSYGNRTYSNGQAGALYKQHIPLVNASRPPGTWQSYDIVFRAPRFGEDGMVTEPATCTVLHNGILIQDHVELAGDTVYSGLPRYTPHPDRLPLLLQDHGSAVSYRNIWIREL
jgi:hypothetical protein